MSRRYVHDEMAGNFHDIWKHFILAEYLEMLSENEEEITYIDTHAGAFGYRNDNVDQLATGWLNTPDFYEKLPNSAFKNVLSAYGATLQKNGFGGPVLLYPGSMAIASYFFRKNVGQAIGCDLNSEMAEKCRRDIKLFQRFAKTRFRLSCYEQEGISFARQYIKHHPQRTGIVFVDPTYYPHAQRDWDSFNGLIADLNNNPRWNFILWYCVYTDDENSSKGFLKNIMDSLAEKSVPSLNIQLQIRPLTQIYAKSITGILIINPFVRPSNIAQRLLSSGLQNIADLLSCSHCNWGPLVKIDIVGG